jgi:hypothetical protein
VEMYQFLSRGSQGSYELLLLIICFLLCTGQAFLVANLDVSPSKNTSLFTLMAIEEAHYLIPLSGYVMKRELVYCAMRGFCAYIFVKTYKSFCGATPGSAGRVGGASSDGA